MRQHTQQCATSEGNHYPGDVVGCDCGNPDLPAPPAEALDFEAARTEALRADYTAMGETFQSNVPWAQYEAMYKMPLMSSLRAALNTQYREAVARARREVLEEVKAKFDQRPLLTTIDILGWLDTQLREGQ